VAIKELNNTDDALIALIRSRNPRCVSALYDAYSKALFGVILRIVQNRELAEEVLQDTFTKVWRSIDSYDTKKGRLYTWLVNIARNSAIDATRAKHFRYPQMPIEYAVHTINERHYKTTNTDTIGIKQLTETLPTHYRILIDLIYFQGFTQLEAAEYMVMPLGTVKTHLRAAMTQLKCLF
jgi:RNA polymerase sigma factor (sigma-70 family)